MEDTLNGLLGEEAGDLVGAERYERTADRDAYRAGHCERKLTTTSGGVTIGSCVETSAYTGFLRECRRRIGADSAVERLNRQIRRRIRVVGTFPDGGAPSCW